MSDHEEKKLDSFDDSMDDFSSMSIDELIASTKADIARVDRMMGTSRLPDAQEEESAETPDAPVPDAGEVTLDDGEEPSQSAEPAPEPFEPKLPEEYADLSLDNEQTEDAPEEPERPRLAAGIKVLLYVCCVLAASVILAVVGWRLADDVLALTKPDEEVTITVPENATVADVSRELKKQGLIEYEWLFRFYCLYSHAERKIQPGTYELNHLYDYHALVNGMTPSAGVRATTEVTIPEGYECEDIFALLEEAGVASAADAGGHAHKQNVVSVFQHRADVVDKALRRNLRGCDLFAVSHRGVKCLGVERGGVHARLLTGFGVEGEGNHGDILRLQICGREIGGSIGHDAKHNNRFFLSEFASDALHKIITFSKLCQPIYMHRLSCICVKKLL